VAAKKAAKTRRKRTRTNFHSKGTLLGEHVAGIVYYHGATNYRGQWTHKFPKSKGVVRMYAMPNGELLLKGSKPLFEEHLVPDDT
jgi:hypothetical protein